MTFQTIMNAVQTLSVREKQKLFQVLSIDLHQITALENASSLFWNPQPLATLLQQQRGLVLSNLRELAVDFWPNDESADEINAFVAAQRKQ